MAKDTMSVEFVETDVAKATTTVQGFIDDFWASLDVNYTPSAITLVANLVLTVVNGSSVTLKFPATFKWTEDAEVQETRMKNIFAAFTAGLTAMEAASSYTTVTTLGGRVSLKVTYA